MALTIFRVDLSSYHATDYVERESWQILQIPGLTYTQKLPHSQGPIALITTSNTVVEDLPQELLAKTVLLLHPNSGHDNFPPAWVEKQNFPMILGNNIRSEAVAQYQLACLYHHYQTPPFGEQWDLARKWNRTQWRDLKGIIFGLGHIGERMMNLLSNLGVELTLIDPYSAKKYTKKILSHSDLKNADFILLCCNLNQKNHHMIDASFLNQLKENAVFINTARGKLVDEKALLEHAHQNPNFTAYLDVFETEPFTTKFSKNIFTTSHIAGVSNRIDQDVINFNYQAILDFQTLPKNEFAQKYQDQNMLQKIREEK